eukprot:760897-Hanusia_phi.AAC.1
MAEQRDGRPSFPCYTCYRSPRASPHERSPPQILQPSASATYALNPLSPNSFQRTGKDVTFKHIVRTDPERELCNISSSSSSSARVMEVARILHFLLLTIASSSISRPRRCTCQRCRKRPEDSRRLPWRETSPSLSVGRARGYDCNQISFLHPPLLFPSTPSPPPSFDTLLSSPRALLSLHQHLQGLLLLLPLLLSPLLPSSPPLLPPPPLLLFRSTHLSPSSSNDKLLALPPPPPAAALARFPPSGRMRRMIEKQVTSAGEEDKGARVRGFSVWKGELADADNEKEVLYDARQVCDFLLFFRLSPPPPHTHTSSSSLSPPSPVTYPSLLLLLL